ncbi:hypothetical protein DAEQUDRAFT_729413 [Daedalea quercina L-15889]|uniref:NADH dehydrogenase [ubiquinone] 1 beta subcomplex subunit 2 n=1 Tax=Daedalea quercina L-15889 TaxID=1314783 RepID=A0A165NN88_9APHY|nr:hypothetical protein DAEQUDRAFT_729413 [Daedalea quercina L-15889]
MAGGHYSPGFHPHLPGFKYKFLATGLGATMWFFIFYRARKDGAKLLGLSHPWEAHGHGHGEADHHDQHH